MPRKFQNSSKFENPENLEDVFHSRGVFLFHLRRDSGHVTGDSEYQD